MIGPRLKNGRPSNPALADCASYGLTPRQIWRNGGTERWSSMTPLAKRVIANELHRHAERICAT